MTKGKRSWEQGVLTAMRGFAASYQSVYVKKDRVLSAYFEIGCFLALVRFYEGIGFSGDVMNPDPDDDSYRYLTTPAGNPANFSYMLMSKDGESIELRQQVRIVSHVGDDIAFTPDIVVLPAETEISEKKDPDYAGGKKRFFHVKSDQVIAAHECKSLPPFPELLISFIGTIIAAHDWINNDDVASPINEDGDHLAPSLFVGGTARALHLRMIKGLKNAYPMNIVVGMHSGTWNLLGGSADVRRMDNPLADQQAEGEGEE